ncbi:MAG: hypothetical protein AAF206_19950 [Bacteroidota bacterium]
MNNICVHILWFLFLLLGSHNVLAQQRVNAELGFVTDTMSLGKAVSLRMVVEHPEEIGVIFPDRRSDFQPFELLRIDAEPTRTVNGVSLDAVTYQVRSFAVQLQQEVVLHIGTIEGQDTSWQPLKSGVIQRIPRLSAEAEQPAFRAQKDWIPLAEPPNYTLVLLLLSGLIAFAAVIIYVLRKPVKRILAKRSLINEWNQIKRNIRRITSVSDQRILFDELNVLWKTYLDPEEDLALRTLTTTELKDVVLRIRFLNAEQQQTLLQTARSGDMVIYACKQFSSAEAKRFCTQVLNVMHSVYKEKQKQLRARKS